MQTNGVFNPAKELIARTKIEEKAKTVEDDEISDE